MTRGGQQTLERRQVEERPELPDIRQESHPHLAAPKKLGVMQDDGLKKQGNVIPVSRSKQKGKVSVGNGEITGVFSLDDDKVYLEGAGVTVKFAGKGVELYYSSRDGKEERVPANVEEEYGREIYYMILDFVSERAEGRKDRRTDLNEKEMKDLMRKFANVARSTDSGAKAFELEMAKNKRSVRVLDEKRKLIGIMHQNSGNLERINEDGDLEEVRDVEERNLFEAKFRSALSDPKVKKNFSDEEAEELLERYSARTKEIEARTTLARRSEALERTQETAKREKRRKAAERERKEQQREQRKREDEAEQLLLEKPENILTLDPQVRRRMEKRKSPLLIKLYQERPDLHEKVKKAA